MILNVKDQLFESCRIADLKTLPETLAGFMDAVSRNAEHRRHLFCGKVETCECGHSLFCDCDIRGLLSQFQKETRLYLFKQGFEFVPVFFGENRLM